MAPEVLEIAIEPRTKADQEKMGIALSSLAAEDPSFRVTTDRESGQTIICGSGELQLATMLDRMKHDFNVEMEVGALQVSYREYLMRTVEIDYTHKKHTGPRPEFGRIKVRVVPRESGSGVQFVDEVKHGNIPAEFIPSVEKGMREVAQAGLVIGFPITDFEIHLMDGAYHDMDSSALAFEVTGRGAMREAALNAGVGVVEPIMRVEAVTQRDHLGRVIGALNGRGVEIQPAKTRDGAVAVVAMAPMRKLFGIEKELKESTDGETDVEIMWERYAPVDTSGTDPDDTFPAAAALCA